PVPDCGRRCRRAAATPLARVTTTRRGDKVASPTELERQTGAGLPPLRGNPGNHTILFSLVGFPGLGCGRRGDAVNTSM
ncbi:MAG: hypothetical protein WCA32_24115, partial [Chromatiaceae bacterium]